MVLISLKVATVELTIRLADFSTSILLSLPPMSYIHSAICANIHSFATDFIIEPVALKVRAFVRNKSAASMAYIAIFYPLASVEAISYKDTLLLLLDLLSRLP